MQSTSDNVIIAKEELSRKEMLLKDRLYRNCAPKSMSGVTKQLTSGNPKVNKPGTDQELVLQGDQEIYNERPVTKFPIKDRPTSSELLNKDFRSDKRNINDVMNHRAGQINEVTDTKMNSFLDEMRQQFLTTQNTNVIPQSLMYRQTQLMEQQVQMLEKNQNQMGEVINNIMNQGATGHESGAGLKQNIFNENRRMMLEMMVPLNQQLNEMKLLYENTKTCSTDLDGKIESLKRVMTSQLGTLQSGTPSASYQGNAPQGTFGGDGLLDPTLLQKGISVIKEQMMDVQKEALAIETEMERRFSDMIAKNTQHRYMPKSLTEEIVDYKVKTNQKEQEVSGEAPESVPKAGFALVREAIMDRLGGEFDYINYQGELREITSELDQFSREFKSSALVMPDFKEKDFGGVAFFDYSIEASEIDEESTEAEDTPAKQREVFSAPAPSMSYSHHHHVTAGHCRGHQSHGHHRCHQNHKHCTCGQQRIGHYGHNASNHFVCQSFDEYKVTNVVRNTTVKAAVEEKGEVAVKEHKPVGTGCVSGFDCNRFSSPGYPNHYYENQFGGMKKIQTPGKANEFVSGKKTTTITSSAAGKTTTTIVKPKQKSTDFSEAFAGQGAHHQSTNIRTSTGSFTQSRPKTTMTATNVAGKDLLSLKRQVIDEIRSEFDLEAPSESTAYKGIARPGYIDPFSRLEQKMPESQAGKGVSMKGAETFALNPMARAKEERSQENELRQSSVTYVGSQATLNEDQVLSAVAAEIMNQVNGESLDRSLGGSVSNSVDMRKMGEDLIVEKIHKIFDEVAHERQDFEESYVSIASASRRTTGQGRSPQRRQPLDVSASFVSNRQQPNRSTSRGRNDREPQPNSNVPQPMIMPIIVTQDGGQQRVVNQPMSAGTDVNQLRDMIQQAVSSQLQLYNIRNNHGMHTQVQEEYDHQDGYRTTGSVKSEDAKLHVEQQLLRKQIPINVNPYLASQTQANVRQSYQNPFFFTAGQKQGTSIHQSLVQKPLLLDNLLSDDSSSFLSNDHDCEWMNKNKLVIKDYERSEGEVGGQSDLDGSVGEIKVKNYLGMTQGEFEVPVEVNMHPTVVDSQERSPQKVKMHDVYASGESFGVSPIPKVNCTSGPAQKVRVVKTDYENGERQGRIGAHYLQAADNKRQTIKENFLEDRSDESSMEEDGEIDPRMFA